MIDKIWWVLVGAAMLFAIQRVRAVWERHKEFQKLIKKEKKDD